jgi:alpha-tubulin suppressor-like RCC1 family protein
MAALLITGCGRIGYDALAVSGDDADVVDADPAVVVDADTRPKIQLAGGWYHMCALYNGVPVCWGDGQAGPLGDGEQAIKTRAVQVIGLPGAATKITAARQHSCALVNGDAYCWGTDANGQLGIGGVGGVQPPTQVMNLAAGSVTDISAGHTFTCAISNGDPYCWGANGAGQLGIGNNMQTDLPLPVVGIPVARTAVAIDSGEDHACALLDDNTAYCWGHDDAGALGAGVGSTTSAVQVQTLTNIGQITISGWHACATQDGAAWCWGMGTNGELGNGMNQDSSAPVPVPSLPDSVFDIACAGGPADRDATCAIRNGVISCWGNNQFGRLGDGTTMASNVPLPVSGLPAAPLHVVGGMDHFCTALDDYSVWCWGRGIEGQLGDTNQTDSLIPVQVDF